MAAQSFKVEAVEISTPQQISWTLTLFTRHANFCCPTSGPGAFPSLQHRARSDGRTKLDTTAKSKATASKDRRRPLSCPCGLANSGLPNRRLRVPNTPSLLAHWQPAISVTMTEVARTKRCTDNLSSPPTVPHSGLFDEKKCSQIEALSALHASCG